MPSHSHLEKELKCDLITILCPTKGRPERVKAMVQSCLTLADNPENLRFVFYVDYNDSFSIKGVDFGKAITASVEGNKIWLSLMYNTMAAIYPSDLYMYAADDILFRTEGWDSLVRESFQSLSGRFGLVFPNDLSSYQGKIATHGFVHRIWIETLGYFLPPYFVDTHTDLWITNLARDLGVLRYLQDVKIEHVHYRQGKSNMDQTYSERLLSTKTRKTKQTYKKLKKEFRAHLVIAGLKHNLSIPVVRKHIVGYCVVKFLGNRLDTVAKIKFLSSTNIEILVGLSRRAIKLFSPKVKQLQGN